MLSVLLTIISEISAGPYGEFDRIISSPVGAVDRLDDDYYVNYRPRQNAPRNSLLSRLRRGYYYIDDGAITPVSPNQIAAAAPKAPKGQRRQDFDGFLPNSINDDNLPNGVKFTPLVRYKQTKTNRKKLFVPNFFG